MIRPLLTLLVLLWLAAPLRASDEPDIQVKLGSSQVSEGRPVVYQVQVSGRPDIGEPQLKGFDDFEVVSLGKQMSMGNFSISIINGQATQTSEGAKVAFNYRLTPRKLGTLKVPAPIVTIDGKEHKGRELTLQVLPADRQDAVLVQIKADRTSVYPTQPFTVTLSIFVKPLPGGYAQRDPVGVQDHPPALLIPWAVDEKLPEGLAPSSPWNQWLKQWENSEGENAGFGINSLSREDMFTLFAGASIKFHPKPHRTPLHDRDGHEVLYWQYDFPRTFTAKKIADYTFGRVTLEGTFGTRLERFGELAGDEIYAIGRAIEVRVKDVPEQGRPDTYCGAIGKFAVTAEMAPRQVKVGDPMTFTLSLSGQGSLQTTIAPDLTKIPGVGRRFKIYEATQQVKDNVCHFTYSLRPQVEGNEPFPPVAIAYFDAEAEKYVPIQSEPIPIEVAKADRLSGEQIVATAAGSARTKADLEVRREGIFANVTDVDEVRDESVRPERWLAGLGGMAGLYLGVVLVTARLRRLAADPARVRRRGAAAKVHHRLRKARAEFHARRPREAAEQLRAAVVGLVADAADLSEAGLTARDVRRQFESWELDPDLIARVERLLDTCDAARYGATDGAIDALADSSPGLLETLLANLKAKKRLR
jgi:hypothetical protein